MEFPGIGRTVDEVNADYGVPVGASGTVVEYNHEGFAIFVVFADGKSTTEIYSHLDGSLFSESEVAAILAANADDGALWRFFDVGWMICWLLPEKHIRVTYKPYASPPAAIVEDDRVEGDPRWKGCHPTGTSVSKIGSITR